MRPLMTATTRRNSVAVMDAEEQTRLLDQDKQQCSNKDLVCIQFLLGSVHGFAFYGVGYWGFATYYSAFKFSG